MEEKRCENIILIDKKPTVCNALLYKGKIIYGSVEIKCHRCKNVTVINAKGKVPLVLAEIG